MAIPLSGKTFRDIVGRALDEAFQAEKDYGWAVFYEYNQNDMTYRVTKVELWDPWDHDEFPGLLHIAKAPDELGAYTQAMQILERH